MTSTLSVSEVSRADEFKALRAEWNDLVENDPRATFFQTWEFQYHTWRIFSDSVCPCLLLVRNDAGELIGCAPLGTRIWRAGPFSVRVLEFASLRHCDYSSFLLRRGHEEQALAALAEWLHDNLRRWDVIWLRSVREDSLLMRGELFLSRVGRPFKVEQRSAAPYLKFQSGWSSYEDALGTKRARGLRYKVKKLFRKFDGRFRTTSRGQALDQAFTGLIDLHQKRMGQKHQAGAFAGRRAQECFHDLVQQLGERGKVRMHTIGSEERTIAAICMFEFRGTISYYQGGFDPSHQQLSPGLVIHCLGIDAALEEGASEYDFLDGDEAYKFTWANGERKIYSMRAAVSWRAVPYYLLEKLRVSLGQVEWVRALYLRLRKKAPDEKRSA